MTIVARVLVFLAAIIAAASFSFSFSPSKLCRYGGQQVSRRPSLFVQRRRSPSPSPRSERGRGPALALSVSSDNDPTSTTVSYWKKVVEEKDARIAEKDQQIAIKSMLIEVNDRLVKSQVENLERIKRECKDVICHSNAEILRLRGDLSLRGLIRNYEIGSEFVTTRTRLFLKNPSFNSSSSSPSRAEIWNNIFFQSKKEITEGENMTPFDSNSKLQSIMKLVHYQMNSDRFSGQFALGNCINDLFESKAARKTRNFSDRIVLKTAAFDNNDQVIIM